MRTLFLSVVLLFALPVLAAPPQVSSFDSATKTFRLDGGNVSYIFGVNEREELQSVYWGTRLQSGDSMAQVKLNPGR